MKKKHILIYFTACILLFTSCKEKELEFEQDYPLGRYCIYTNIIESVSDSYFQVADSIYHFNYIEGYYMSYKPTFNMNVFVLQLKEGFQNNSYPIRFQFFTSDLKPEVFFQKGSYNIDTLYIYNNDLSASGLGFRKEYYGIRSIFTWKTVYYDNGEFTGKGSFEIMDTLLANYSEIYYPPQKIEFEFK